MLEDPDSLLAHPEIMKIMDEQAAAGGGDDWDTSAESESAPVSQEKQVVAEAAPVAKSSSAAVESAPSPMKREAVEGDEGDADEEVNASSSTEVLVEGDPREHLNLVFIGHVDAGKSTLSGSILYLMGKVDSRTIERFEREAKQRNRESWFLAFIMDTSEEERAKGKTVEVGRAHFETDVNRYTILDAPGHKNYVPNMIAGTYEYSHICSCFDRVTGYCCVDVFLLFLCAQLLCHRSCAGRCGHPGDLCSQGRVRDRV